MDACYAFRVRFRLEPTVGGVRVDPREFETRPFRAANDPGTEGWLFFRDNLWRGELGDERHFRTLTEDALDVPAVSVSYCVFETDREHLDALEAEIGANLDRFDAESGRCSRSTSAVRSKSGEPSRRTTETSVGSVYRPSIPVLSIETAGPSRAPGGSTSQGPYTYEG